MKTPCLTLAALLLLQVCSVAQAPTEWQDRLVDRMAGTWKMEGQVMGQEAHHEVRAEWVLNHQFLRIHEKTAPSAPNAERPYEAIWFLGYDPVSERYVLHLMDVFGTRYSETLGYGTRDGKQIRFVFEYPDGPFHTTYQWNAEKNTWHWLMEQKDKNGKWTPFADLKLTRLVTP
jgi:Protein of unknown function (DUF1579)